MTTILYSHDACLGHDPGAGHPERPDRLRAIAAALQGDEFAALDRREAPPGGPEQVELAHPAHHVDRVLGAVPPAGLVHIDGDTVVGPGSREAALRAVGAICAAVDAVSRGDADNAFCAVRPPGHHAEPERAMGFCLFNNVAIGAYHARRECGLSRVAVVDFDVHHGNGTQTMFEADPDMFYGSTHQWPLYPGTGAENERGVGNIVNAPLEPMAGSAEFRGAMDGRILPALDAFAPDLVMISAGFDAHRDDPLASLNLTEDDFGWATSRLAELARLHCGGRLVSTLEGGYNLRALGASSAAHVRALMAA